ncbi:MAG: V-type ATP synthase subunit D [Phycisphaeraceae bacterium]|nr:V-type ATP synthase subunit D [Phycisphaeraceae bacterium]
MAKRKIKLTRTELKSQRDALARYERYLPTLKLKQQQVQSSIVQVKQAYDKVDRQTKTAQQVVDAYKGVFNDVAGVNVQDLARTQSVETSSRSVAGIPVPQFEGVTFGRSDYSLFGTAPWVDRAVLDLREVNRLMAELTVLKDGLDLLLAELKKVMQRVNLFEKIKIPETQDNIRRIRIAVGDQMTAGVARAKIAKAKLVLKELMNRSREVAAV